MGLYPVLGEGRASGKRRRMRLTFIVLTCEEETMIKKEETWHPIPGWKSGETKREMKRVVKADYCTDSKENLEEYLRAQDRKQV